MKRFFASAILLLVASSARATALPGFRAQLLGPALGFASSIAIDSHDTIYYTTTKGDVVRFGVAGATVENVVVAHVITEATGDSGLLGMALRDDATAVVHYTTPGQTYDVISTIDLRSGAESVLHAFAADIQVPERGSPAEHHGGNPIVASDGSVFVGIGDYGTGLIASFPEWNAGKIWRIAPDGTATQFARGFRNPFDMSWDAAKQRLVLTDNGDVVDDEINIVTEGNDYGWPFTAGNEPPVAGDVPPIYTFPMVVAPTGLTALSGRNPILRHGYLLGAFVTKAIYYIPDIDVRPLPDPIALIQKETASVIDVAEGPNGDIYFVTGSAIYKLNVPKRGDCNGDGVVNAADLLALAKEVAEGPRPMTDAQNGSYAGTWGCDVNGDGWIDSRDLAALENMIRSRAVRK